MSSFASSLIAWQREHGRHDLPWQGGDAYRIWLSEVMLQQTQVSTVIPYYLRFVAAFPNIGALAKASEEEVLSHWSGLGYYARGRNLHKAARVIVEIHGGEFPKQYEDILNLPGVGRSTAAAISAQAFGERRAILDGNVKRLLARYCGIYGQTSARRVEEALWRQADALLPCDEIAVYTQALMDMGAMLCARSRPKCASCPVQSGCAAFNTGCVDRLPEPRLRKRAAERRMTFLLMVRDREILLEKREPSGIWGGLWSLPQLDEGELAEYTREWEISEQAALPSFTHVFTHFRLHIDPVLIQLEKKPLHRTEHAWMDVDEALQAAIPTPVRKLLSSLPSPSRALQHL